MWPIIEYKELTSDKGHSKEDKPPNNAKDKPKVLLLTVGCRHWGGGGGGGGGPPICHAHAWCHAK